MLQYLHRPARAGPTQHPYSREAVVAAAFLARYPCGIEYRGSMLVSIIMQPEHLIRPPRRVGWETQHLGQEMQRLALASVDAETETGRVC